MAIEANQTLRIGIDIGGTFTDFVILSSDSGEFETFKILSTPDEPSKAVLQGIGQILERYASGVQSLKIIHGSTVATNALLERKGAPTALITTYGFRDVLEIGRQNRQDLYRFSVKPVTPLVPRQHRYEIHERIDHTGKVLRSLQDIEVEELLSSLEHSNCESIAVCFLFSFINPTHEQVITARLRQAGYFVSPSIEVLPEFREYERASTTVVNAYVTPVLDRYLERLDTHLKRLASGGEIQVMQSNGGNISIREARQRGVHCILSGPAGGIIGAELVSRQAAKNFDMNTSELKVITFDMGGTSTDVSLIDGSPKITNEAIVGGYPIRIPVLDIHTIGAGGGSIASVDAGGALRVGPQSAGANPGPACYGRGNAAQDRATVTDANLVLGRLASDYFLGGRMPLHPDRAWKTLREMGVRLQLDPIQTALGIVQVVNAHMARALRVISVERGYDPRDFTLVSFGGAGGLHASDLAKELGIPRVLVPAYASTLSAYGMLGANAIKDYSRTVMLEGNNTHSKIDELLNELAKQGINDLIDEGFELEAIVILPALDMRYRGQSYELVIPYQEDYVNIFHERHQATYGYARREAHIEIVNIRLRATGIRPGLPNQVTADQGSDPFHAFIAHREAYLNETPTDLPFFNGETLAPGNHIPGPAIVLRTDTTILINQGDIAKIDGSGNLLLQIGE